MKVRFLGHSCVEILGRYHILIDPDFIHPPLPEVDYICITHAHLDHIGRVAEVESGVVLASSDVCHAAERLGVPRARLHPVGAGDRVMNIRILPGYSARNGFIHSFFSLIIKHKLPAPAGTPLSFLVEDAATLLHIGDAYRSPSGVQPDILCLPWRKAPFRHGEYKEALCRMADELNPKYVLPIHFDIPGTEADPQELMGRVKAEVLIGDQWHRFNE